MALVAIYETEDKKKRLEIPIARVGKDSFLVTESGEHVEIENSLKDVYFGKLDYKDTVEIPDPLPRPVNHELRAAVAQFNKLYGSSFRSAEEERSFMTAHKEIQTAFNNDFKDTTITELADWSKLVKASVAAPKYGRYELTRDFRHSRQNYGDLKIESIYKDGTPERNWEDVTWYCRCGRCEKEGTAPRSILARTLLSMEDGSQPKFVCGNPCKGR
jgi:hypothetical protein